MMGAPYGALGAGFGAGYGGPGVAQVRLFHVFDGECLCLPWMFVFA